MYLLLKVRVPLRVGFPIKAKDVFVEIRKDNLKVAVKVVYYNICYIAYLL